MSSARVTPFVVGFAHFGVSLCVGAVHLVFVPQLLVELPHLIRFQVEDTEDRLHPVLDGYALLPRGGKNRAAACQRISFGGPAGAPPGAIGDTAEPDAAAEPGLGNTVVSRWNEQAPGTARRKEDRTG